MTVARWEGSTDCDLALTPGRKVAARALPPYATVERTKDGR